MLQLLANLLQRQRARGRTAAADAVNRLVIEEGEAEGLVAELAAAWDRSASPFSSPRERPPRFAAADGSGTTAEFLPLRHAVRAFDLRSEEYHALLLALAVELDARFGRLVAYLNDHVSRTRPTLGLALFLAGEDGEPLSSVEFCDRPVIKDGLLELDGEGPLPGLALRAPRELLRRLTSETALDPEGPGLRYFPAELGLLDRIVLEAAIRERLLADLVEISLSVYEKKHSRR